jgi:hypothetical protein
MKKIIFLMGILVIAATSFSQNQNNTETNRSDRSSTSRSNTQQERRAPTTTNHTSTDQRQSNERANPAQHTNSNPGNVNRNQDSRNRDNTQNGRSPVNTTQDRHDRPGNNDRNQATINSNQPINVNRTDVRHPVVRDYASPRIDRERHEPIHHYDRPPVRGDYRVHHFVYRAPVELNIYWSRELYRNYVRMYPMVRNWDYPIGYHIESVPAYDADKYRGAVITVYGQINEAYYSMGTDEYFLYFGPFYPYQDFTVVLPGPIARRYSGRPDLYFSNQNLAITGLITSFEGDPEIVVKEPFQLNMY